VNLVGWEYFKNEFTKSLGILMCRKVSLVYSRNLKFMVALLLWDSLTEICYAFIGAVGKLQIFYTFFIPSIFKNIVISCRIFDYKLCHGGFLLSHKTVN
jgi:hypothetical protein